MLTKPFKKEDNNLKTNIYKFIPNVDEKYINRVLIESCPINVLERILFKEDTSRILKFAKCKLKINTKNYTKEQVKELGIIYLEDDSKKTLYDNISSRNIISVNKLFSMRLAEKKITLDIFNDENDFIKNINILLSEINVFLLISYIRAKHDNLFNIIPYILKEFEDSQVYITSGMKDEGYKISFEEKFSQKYGFELEFEDDYTKNKEDENNHKKEVSLDMDENEISTNINNIINELQSISNIFETLEVEKSRIETLENDLKESEKLLRKSKNQILKNEEEIKGLKDELDIYATELENKKASIENLHDTIKYKTEKETELKIQITQLNKSIKETEVRSNKQLKNMQKDLEESLQKQLNLSKVCENLKEISQQFEKKIDELKNELIETSYSLKQSLSKNKNLEDENDALKSKVRELEEKINNSDLNITSGNIQEESVSMQDKDYDESWTTDIDDLLNPTPKW